MNETARQVVMPILHLPGKVMLPHATRLLRLRAPVVRAIAPALRGERLIAVGVDLPPVVGMRRSALSVDSEVPVCEGEPVCICRALAVRRLPAGEIRVLLRGVSRGVHLSTDHQHGSRVIENATVAFRPDRCFDPPTIDREHRAAELKSLLNCCTPGAIEFPQIRGLFEQSELGNLCDLLADCVGLTGQEGLQLLAAADVELRSDLLLDALRSRWRRQSASESSLVWSSSN